MATACSILLSDHPGADVRMWVRNPEHAQEIAAHRENRRLLPGVPISETVQVTSDIEAAIDGAELLVAAIPTRYLRETLTGISGALIVVVCRSLAGSIVISFVISCSSLNVSHKR